MTGKLHTSDTEQPNHFSFINDNLKQAEAIIVRYPANGRQSAVMPLLMLAQKQCRGWLPKAAMDTVARMLDMPSVRVYEIGTFYGMYNLEPVGRHVINVCTTTPCWLRGSDAIVDACEQHLKINCGETTPDGEFTLREVECLGACVNAPMCQVIDEAGEYFYEDLTPQTMTGLIDLIKHHGKLKIGPQSREEIQ